MKNAKEQIDKILQRIISENHRGLFLIIGPLSVQKIPEIYKSWQKKNPKNKTEILWCFKEKNESETKSGEIFNCNRKFFKNECSDNYNLNHFKIRYCKYDESKKLLGCTFCFAVLEDLEKVSPNNITRIIETVGGGGLIILTMKTVKSFTRINHLASEIRGNFNSNIKENFQGRFLEYFFFSLFECTAFLPLNDELKIIPEFEKMEEIKGLEEEIQKNYSHINSNLHSNLLSSLINLEPIYSLIIRTKTFDQAKALLILIEALSDKEKISTIVLNSPRGRGKSASLGLSAASAIAYGYGNIFVSAPDPENLHSFFAFLFLGFKSLNYVENKDFKVVQNKRLKYIEEISLNVTHRQKIKFIFPEEIEKIQDEIELLIIDEGAAIDQNLMPKIGSNHTTFLGGTTVGYEGSGKYLNFKFLQILKENSIKSSQKYFSKQKIIFREIFLEEPIRYGKNDPVEKWVNQAFILDPKFENILLNGCPNPKNCRLYLIDRKLLFSHHKISKIFLQKIFSIFSASHYKNSPDDLQLLCDAPSHRIMILIWDNRMAINLIPEILCTIQVSYEGQISKKFIKKSLKKKIFMRGDLTPWVLSKEYYDPSFAELPGIRVIRIATHPDVRNMGYGTTAVKELLKYCSFNKQTQSELKKRERREFQKTYNEKIPSLLVSFDSRICPLITYISASFSLSIKNLSFWQKNGFKLLCLRQKEPLRGKINACIFVKKLRANSFSYSDWFEAFSYNCTRKFIHSILISNYNLNIQETFLVFSNLLKNNNISAEQLYQSKYLFSPIELKKLAEFGFDSGKNFCSIRELLPLLAKICIFFAFKIPIFNVLEISLCIGIGLLNKTTSQIKTTYSINSKGLSNSIGAIVRKFLVLVE